MSETKDLATQQKKDFRSEKGGCWGAKKKKETQNETESQERHPGQKEKEWARLLTD